MSRALRTRVTSAPAGGSSGVGPMTSRTRAPRASASAATAKPMRPVDRLPRYRTGSRSSQVGPAVTSTVRPTNRPSGLSSWRLAATISAGSASLPLPIQPHAR